MIEDKELRTEALKNLLGKDDDRLPRLIKADQRCLEEGLKYPCNLCAIQGQIARTQVLNSLSTAQKIADICCPEGKIPNHLKYQ